MQPRVIRNAKAHEAALARIDALMAAEPGTPEGAELDQWVALVDCYEQEHFPIAAPDPVAAIRFREEHAGPAPQTRERHSVEYGRAFGRSCRSACVPSTRLRVDEKREVI